MAGSAWRVPAGRDEARVMTQLRSATKIPPLLFLLIVIPLLLPAGCARTPVATALERAQRKAAAIKAPDRRITTLTDIGVTLWRHDPRSARTLLDEARQLALGPSKAGPSARLYAISQRASALASAQRDRRRIRDILAQAALDGEAVVRSIGSRKAVPGAKRTESSFDVDSARYEYVGMIGSLASCDPGQALAMVRRLPDDSRDQALMAVAQSIAGTDLSRATRLLEASGPGHGSAAWPSFVWASVCAAATAAQPRQAMSLARAKHLGPDERKLVLEMLTQVLARQPGRIPEELIAQDPDPLVRVRGWLTLAHWSAGRRRESAIRRAAEAMAKARPSKSERFTAVTQWCLLSVLSRPGKVAKRYLAAAEAAQSTPPRVEERGMVMAAACYIDPAKALRIRRALIAERASGDGVSAESVLLYANQLIGLVDPREAERTVTQGPDWEASTAHPAPKLVQTGEQMMTLGADDGARQLVRAAERVLEAEEEHAASLTGGEEGAEPGLTEAREAVAAGLAAIGDSRRALRVAGRIRDPEDAAETYVGIARALEGRARRIHKDPYAALQDVSWFMGTVRADEAWHEKVNAP
jgi:hypothetical protein